MKKIFLFLIVAVFLALALVGCGSGSADAATTAETTQEELEPIEKARARAVAIGEQYLSFEISGDEAAELLKDIKVPTAGHRTGALCLRTSISHLVYILRRSETTYEEIQKEFEEIASLDFDILD